MAKKKYYVVWHGVEPGVYETWNECKAQVSGYDGARYKSFNTREEAEIAFQNSPWNYIGANAKKKKADSLILPNQIIRDSIAVDAACSGNPGLMEYRGVYIDDDLELFRVGPMQQGTNNIGEFLAIVHALALTQKSNREIPIYTDSVNAIKWIDKKKCNTKLQQTEINKPVFDLIHRAEKWLNENSWKNRILKWDTKKWGEIPADFGRK